MITMKHLVKHATVAGAMVLGLAQPSLAQTDHCKPLDDARKLPGLIAVSIAGSDTLLNYASNDSVGQAPNKYLLRIENNAPEHIEIGFLDTSSIEISFEAQNTEVSELRTGVIGASDFVQKINGTRDGVETTPDDDGVIKFPIDDAFRLHPRKSSKVGAQTSFDILVEIPATTAMSGKAHMYVELKNVGFHCLDKTKTREKTKYGVALQKQPLVFVDENVGIGTADPQAKLHVNGTTRFDGTTVVNGQLGVGMAPRAALDVDGFVLSQGAITFGSTTIHGDTKINSGPDNKGPILWIDKPNGGVGAKFAGLEKLGDFVLGSPAPTIDLIDTDARHESWRIQNRHGNFNIADIRSGGIAFQISRNSSQIVFNQNAIASLDLTVNQDLIVEEKLFVGGQRLEEIIRREAIRIIKEKCRIMTTSFGIGSLSNLDFLTDAELRC